MSAPISSSSSSSSSDASSDASSTSSSSSSSDEKSQSFLLARTSISHNTLVKDHPPRLKEANKKFLYQLCMEGRTFDSSATTTFSRWRSRPLPRSIPYASSMKTSYIEKVYGYEPTEKNTVSWYVNFADAHLFGYYGGPLFAQDEMQVGEHPLCASTREALIRHQTAISGEKQATSPFPSITGSPAELVPFTTSQSGATPCLIYNTPRLCCVDPAPSSSIPHGLYGNAFSHATHQQITLGTTILKPATKSNIVAMEAPKYGRGAYTQSTISSIFNTAYASFMACRDESYHQTGSTNTQVEIHTGNWGCGAYGGNPILMAIIQLVAARAAEIDTIVYHTLSSTREYKQACDALEKFMSQDGRASCTIALSTLFQQIESLQLKWGISNGT